MPYKRPEASSQGPRNLRLPLGDDDRKGLKAALRKVPSETIVHYDWSSEPGTAFLREVDRVRREHVPVPWIAEALGISPDALLNVINRRTRNGTLYKERA